MAPPDNGNGYVPFVDLMALKQLEPTTFRAKALAFSPAGGSMTYGGHVFAQSALAAAQTVGEEFILHNISGQFTLPGLARMPFTYHVRTVRNGRRFCVRTVEVIQEPEKGICFTSTCSFKLGEENPLEKQESVNLREEYQVVLDGKQPMDHPESPGVDSPWYWAHLQSHGPAANDQLPGLRIRKVDMAAFNNDRSFSEKRQLTFYAPIGTLPDFAEAPNLHIAAHLYASDRNSLFLISNFLGRGDDYSQMGSLMHNVIIHTHNASSLSVDPEKWFVQESWMTRAGEGRGMHLSRLWADWNAKEATHLASTFQDGLVRFGGKKSSKVTERQEGMKKRTQQGGQEKL